MKYIYTFIYVYNLFIDRLISIYLWEYIYIFFFLTNRPTFVFCYEIENHFLVVIVD